MHNIMAMVGMRSAVALTIVLLAPFVVLPGLGGLAGPVVAAGVESSEGPPAAAAPASAPPFFPNVDITDESSPFAWQEEPTMVLNESGVVFVGWKEQDTAEGNRVRIGFSHSEDGGETWAKNILMNQSHPNLSCNNSDPWLALAPDDRVHLAYLERCSNYFSGFDVSNTSNGSDWGSVHYLNGSSVDKEAITFDSTGRLYAAWNEGRGELGVTSSDDGGATWRTPFVNPEDDPNPTAGALLGAIVATSANGTVYLTWWNQISRNIYFDWSWNGGVTWNRDVRVNYAGGSAAARDAKPAMNVDRTSGTIYVAWAGRALGSDDVFAAASTDGGRTWSARQRINDDTGSATQYMVDLAVDPAGTVHAAWEDNRTGNWNIFYSNSSDGGQTWTTNLRVSDQDTLLPSTPGYHQPGDYLAIEAGPDAVYVVWTDGRGLPFDIYFARNPGFPAAIGTIDTEPTGLDVVVDGRTSASPVQYAWSAGTSHTISAPSPQPLGSGARYDWIAWSDGGAETHTITFTGTMDLTALFDTEFLLTVTSTAPGASGGGWYLAGSTAYASVGNTIVDTAGKRFTFTGWGGDASGTGATSDPILMDGPKTAVANYEQEFFLTVQSPFGTASGSGWYGSGASATAVISPSPLETEPGARQVFAGWSGDASGSTTTSNPILMDGPKTAIATWRAEYLVTVESDYPGVEGGGWYVAGTTATLQAPPEVISGGQTYTFAGWSGDVVSADPTVTVTVNGPIQVRALWSPVSPLGAPSLVVGLGLLAAVLVAIGAIVVVWLRRRASR